MVLKVRYLLRLMCNLYMWGVSKSGGETPMCIAIVIFSGIGQIIKRVDR